MNDAATVRLAAGVTATYLRELARQGDAPPRERGGVRPKDVIDDHANGILVPPGDTSAFATALRELIEDEPLRRRLGAAAAASAREHGMDAVGPRWEALLETAISERGRPG